MFHDNDELIVNVEDLQVLRVGTGGTGRPRGGTGRHWWALGIRKRHWEVEWEHWEGDWEHWERHWKASSMTTMS